MSLKRKLNIENNEYSDIRLIILKKFKENEINFSDLPLELYQNIIFTDLSLLNTFLQVSKHIRNFIYANEKYILHHITRSFNNNKKRLLYMCFKKGFSEVIKLIYNKGISNLKNREYLKLVLVNGRIGTLDLFKSKVYDSSSYDKNQLTRRAFNSLNHLNYNSLYTFYKYGYRFSESDFESNYNYKYKQCSLFTRSDLFTRLKNNYNIKCNWELCIAVSTNNLELFKWYIKNMDFKIDIYCFYISILTNSTHIFDFITSVEASYFSSHNIKNIIECSVMNVSNNTNLLYTVLETLHTNNVLSQYVDAFTHFSLKYDNPIALKVLENFFVFSNKRHEHVMKKTNDYCCTRILNYYTSRFQNSSFDIDVNQIFIENTRIRSVTHFDVRCLRNIISLGFKIPLKDQDYVFELSKRSLSLFKVLMKKKSTSIKFMEWGYKDKNRQDLFCEMLNNSIT